MSSDIRSILQRFRDLEESQLTPVGVKHGLNKQQKGVPQLPALFKPRHIKALGSKTDPEHPMKGMAVGANESRLAEVMGEIEEDMLSKVKKDLTHYLDKLEKKVAINRDLKDKALDAVHKRRAEEDQVEEDPTTQDPTEVPAEPGVEEPTLPESAPVTMYEMDDGTVIECWGDDDSGYELRKDGKSMPSKFRSRDHADMAVQLFKQRRKQQMANSDQDYIEEK